MTGKERYQRRHPLRPTNTRKALKRAAKTEHRASIRRGRIGTRIAALSLVTANGTVVQSTFTE